MKYGILSPACLALCVLSACLLGCRSQPKEPTNKLNTAAGEAVNPVKQIPTGRAYSMLIGSDAGLYRFPKRPRRITGGVVRIDDTALVRGIFEDLKSSSVTNGTDVGLTAEMPVLI